MPVPLLDTRRQNAPIQDQLRDAAARVLASGQYILGPEVERFEEACAALAGARFAVGVSSGTDAILAALMAAGIGAGDEVICPSFTFFATAGCVARTGATPVFADSGASFNIDAAAIEALITPRTKAVIPVHLFGQPADMDEILALAARRGLLVIEDAAQAFGAIYGSRGAGSMGACGTVSFYPSKNLGGFGEGGLILTNDAAFAAKLRLFRNHGAEQQYIHRAVGGNFRLDALQAALLAVKLPLLKRYTAARQRHAVVYDAALRPLEGRVVTPARLPGRTHIMNQYTIRVPGRRDALRAFLAERGIASAIYYPVPLHLQECFRGSGRPPALPVAETLAAEAVSLPIFPELLPEEQTVVVEAIHAFFAAAD